MTLRQTLGSIAFVRQAATRLGLVRRRAAPRDLQKIAGQIVPENKAYFSSRAAASDIEGMFSNFSMAIIDSLLSFQTEAGFAGSMLEFGVYRGRSAAILGRHLKAGERLVLVDIADYLDRRSIAPFGEAAEFFLCATENFRKEYRAYRSQRRKFRFIHIDASHAYRATFTELAMADELLADDGIIALDDFTNLNYSQNIAAIFKYLHTTGTSLTPFLVTDEKAYLCRRDAFPVYAAFVLDSLISQMGSRGESCCLARTDDDPEYRAFYARPPADGEGAFYGIDIYQGRLQL